MAGSWSATPTMSLSWGQGCLVRRHTIATTNAGIEYTEGNVPDTGYSPTSAGETNHLGAPS